MNQIVFLFLFLSPLYFIQSTNKDKIEQGFRNDTIVTLQDTVPKKNINDKVLEQKVIAKFFSIPEVKKKNKFIDSLSHHKRSISIIIMRKPDKKNNNYWVQDIIMK